MNLYPRVVSQTNTIINNKNPFKLVVYLTHLMLFDSFNKILLNYTLNVLSKGAWFMLSMLIKQIKYITIYVIKIL